MELTEIEKIAKENYSSAILQNKWNECINFALFLLDNEIESENIYILAGLDENNYDDIKKYFFSVITELGITNPAAEQRGSQLSLFMFSEGIAVGFNTPCFPLLATQFQDEGRGIKPSARIKKIDEDINYSFLCYLGRKTQNNEIESIYALKILEQMYYKTNDERFMEWIAFGDAVDLLENGINDYSYGYEINKNNLSDYIKEKILLDMELYKKEIPEHFYNMGFCEKCNSLVIPETGKSFFTKKIFYKCSNCKTKNSKFLWCCDNKGKRRYLEMIK